MGDVKERMYLENNFYPDNYFEVVFVDHSGGDYRLSSSSPHRNAATDGRDVGVDSDATAEATKGVVEGWRP